MRESGARFFIQQRSRGFGIHSDGGENLDFLTGFSIYSDW